MSTRNELAEAVQNVSRAGSRASSDAPKVARAHFMTGRRAVRVVTFFVFFFVALLITWSFIAKLEEVAVARGEIISLADIEMVQHLEGGMIDAYYVKEGDIVQKGDLLLRLKDTNRYSERVITQHKYESHRLNAERFSALIEKRRPDFKSLTNDRSLLIANIRLYKALKRSDEREDQLFDTQLSSQTSMIESIKNRIESSKKQLALMTEQVKMRENLTTVSRLEVINAEVGELNMLREIENLEESLMTSNQELEKLEVEYTKALTERLSEYTDGLKKEEETALELSQTLAVNEDKVRRLDVRSPVYGVVDKLPLNYKSAIVSPAGVIAEIIPLSEGMIAEIKILPKDIGFVQEKQRVAVKLDAFNYTKYGHIEGHLRKISSTTVKEEKDVYYRGEVELYADHLEFAGQIYRIKPGMELNGDVHTGEKRVIEYIVKPVVHALREAFRER